MSTIELDNQTDDVLSDATWQVIKAEGDLKALLFGGGNSLEARNIANRRQPWAANRAEVMISLIDKAFAKSELELDETGAMVMPGSEGALHLKINPYTIGHFAVVTKKLSRVRQDDSLIIREQGSDQSRLDLLRVQAPIFPRAFEPVASVAPAYDTEADLAINRLASAMGVRLGQYAGDLTIRNSEETFEVAATAV